VFKGTRYTLTAGGLKVHFRLRQNSDSVLLVQVSAC